MATLRIVRGSGWVDMLRSYTILLDGKSAGKLAGDEELVLQTVAGVHTLQARIDWCSSQIQTFSIADTDRLTFECGPAANVLTALFYVIFARSSYLRLQQV